MRFKMHIRQRFLVFLMLVSIGPLALVSRFFLEDMGNRINERLDSTLVSAGRVAEAFNRNHPSEPTGAINAYSQITQLFPDVELRVFGNTPSRKGLIYSSTPFFQGPEIDPRPKKFIPEKVFRESIGGKELRSLALPMQDSLMILSTSNQTETKALYTRSISLFLFLVGLLVILTAYFFNRSVIRPVNNLIMASKAVSEGDLTVRLNENYRDEEMKDLMQNFNQMLVRLEEEQMLRSTFVSTLTHDLRTPLFAQKRVLEGIEKIKTRYDDDLCLMLDTAQKSNSQVLEMVNKLLEAYQYEAGHIQLKLAPVNINELIQECLDSLQPLAEAENITLVTENPQVLTLEADSMQLGRVFQNLISNAIANIQSGKTIRITAQSQGTSVSIHVIDNGPGIKPELLPHLFQRYFTGDTSQKLGSGLGLYICRMIVELHGGRIMVVSEHGIGTDFHIKLPLKHQPGEMRDG